MALNFEDQLDKDFGNMMSVNEFAVTCTNSRTSDSFGVIKTDVFIGVDDEGIPLTKDTPIINLPLKFDIKQNDQLIIDSVNFIVYEVQPDGINGQDVYLKDA